MAQRCWLLKSEPGAFSLEDLRRSPDQTACWDGVRNYQARNFMRDEMQVGDRVLFYHSGRQPAVVGIAGVTRSGYPDHTAWDPASPHADPRSRPDHPIWYMIDVRFLEAFPSPVPLKRLREVPELAEMILLRKGNRLSVMPIEPRHFDRICRMGRGEGQPPAKRPVAGRNSGPRST